MCCDFVDGVCGHMGRTCMLKDYGHLPEMTAREFCGCQSCKPIYKSLIEAHNERAERVRQNEGKYVPAWRLLGL